MKGEITAYDHLMADFDLRPRQIAAHLRDAHNVEPEPVRKGFEREGWQRQHEDCHYAGISGFRRELPSHLS